MKANTEIHVAMRNFGDASDEGDLFHGTLKDSIIWIAHKLANTSMKKRIAIGIGRDTSGAVAAISEKRSESKQAQNELQSMLDSLFTNQEDDTDDESKVVQMQVAPPLEGDNYIP